jgi:mono/diheme cytochrome c family protein
MGLRSVCQQSKAGPPCNGCDSYTSWAFYGREHLQGPQALAGTWYNLPSGGPADGCGPDGCVSPGWHSKGKHFGAKGGDCCYPDGCAMGSDAGGTWLWMISPEQARVAAASLYNRYCIRCHGVDGRGVWDIPGAPDFTNMRWQLSRSDDQIARIIIQGRGAVMPIFRGTLTLEEAWAMARYLRTFIPGSETPRPDVGPAEKASPPPDLRAPTKEK